MPIAVVKSLNDGFFMQVLHPANPNSISQLKALKYVLIGYDRSLENDSNLKKHLEDNLDGAFSSLKDFSTRIGEYF